ncbi:YqgE/AlgH family protein [Bacteroidota bacterium]
MDLFDYQSNRKPRKGDLLISEPFLPDPNFERSVVLLCEHNEDGSFGFILNKPSILKVDEAINDIEDFPEVLYVGGPVQQNTLHFIHRTDSVLEGSQEVNEEIEWGGNYEQLFMLINTKTINTVDYKFFLGYSGWAPGQLETELEEKSWIVAYDATAKNVFEMEPDDLWRDVLKDMGGKFKIFSNYPVDPRQN